MPPPHCIPQGNSISLNFLNYSGLNHKYPWSLKFSELLKTYHNPKSTYCLKRHKGKSTKGMTSTHYYIECSHGSQSLPPCKDTTWMVQKRWWMWWYHKVKYWDSVCRSSNCMFLDILSNCHHVNIISFKSYPHWRIAYNFFSGASRSTNSIQIWSLIPFLQIAE